MRAPSSVLRRLEAVERQGGTGLVVVDQRATWRGPLTPDGETDWRAEHVAPAHRRGAETVVILRRLFDDEGEPIRPLHPCGGRVPEIV